MIPMQGIHVVLIVLLTVCSRLCYSLKGRDNLMCILSNLLKIKHINFVSLSLTFRPNFLMLFAYVNILTLIFREKHWPYSTTSSIMTITTLNRNNWVLICFLPEKKLCLRYNRHHCLALLYLFPNLFSLSTFWLSVNTIVQIMISINLLLCSVLT